MEGQIVEALGALYSRAYAVTNAMALQIVLPLEICAAYAVLEFVLPRRTRNSLGAYLRGLRFLIVWAVINTIAFTFLRPALGMEDGLKPLALLDLSPLTTSDSWPVRIAGWFAAAFAVSIVGNFFYYWWHRAQHGVPLLWRFHKVHHSIREMSATSSYHHVTEDVFQYILVVFPTAILFGVESGPVPWLVLAIAGTHAVFIHSNAAINIGPLRYVLGENRFHRVHHSLEPRHFGRNFGTTTPIWDALFGTAYFPGPKEWPDVGLADTPEPRTIADYLLMPFQGTARPKSGARGELEPGRQ